MTNVVKHQHWQQVTEQHKHKRRPKGQRRMTNVDKHQHWQQVTEQHKHKRRPKDTDWLTTIMKLPDLTINNMEGVL
jgi:hypothetical protein